MEKQMPQMPTPVKTSDEVGSAPSSISPILGTSAEANVPSLDIPKSAIPEESAKVQISTAETKIHNSLKIPTSQNGFEVIATRAGFYNQFRLKPDERFTIDSWEDIGTWMKMVDPDLEKERVEFFKMKKAKI